MGYAGKGSAYNNSKIAHEWANQLGKEAKNHGNNFFYEGKTIYYYGYHFPIASHYNGIVLFTLDTYSLTTNMHIQEVRSAITHKDKVYCLRPNAAISSNHDKNINYWINKIVSIAEKKLPNAKKPEKYFSEINILKEQMNIYLNTFEIELTDEQKTKITFKNYLEFLDNSIEAARIAEEKEKERVKKLSEKEQIGVDLYNKKIIPSWKNGKINHLYYDVNSNGIYQNEYGSINLAWFNKVDYFTYLRVSESGLNIETSKNMVIPIDVAKRYFLQYLKVVAKGGCGNGDCNYRMLNYPVYIMDKDKLVVGCHNISRKEINYIAKKLNWI